MLNLLIPNLLSKPDMKKILELFEATIAQLDLAEPLAPNRLGVMLGGMLSLFCMKYDVERVHGLIKQFANHPTFWRQMTDMKKTEINLL